LKIIFAGTPQNAAQTLKSLVTAGVQVAAVLTRTDAELGRKKILTPSPVASTANELGLRVFKHNQIDTAALADINSVSADLGLVVAYGSLLKSDALKALPLGWLNLHYSLLPALRGAAPVQHAIMNGFAETGVTVFQLDEGMDSGPVLMQVPTAIEVGETSGHLLSKLTQLGTSALLELLPRISAGFAETTEQDQTKKSFAPKISRESARILWQQNARQIENLVNAMNPEPMAWTTLRGDAVRVISARVYLGTAPDFIEIGSTRLEEGSVIVAAGQDSILQLLEVQPAGKQVMSAQDWFRGQQSKGPVVFE
jgi:methionyl-tRNA formyltransferase